MPLLRTAPRSICARNRAGTAIRPFASIVCSYSPRNICDRVAFSSDELFWLSPVKYSAMFPRILGGRGTDGGRMDASSRPYRLYSPLCPTLPHPNYNTKLYPTKGDYPPICFTQVDNLWITHDIQIGSICRCVFVYQYVSRRKIFRSCLTNTQ